MTMKKFWLAAPILLLALSACSAQGSSTEPASHEGTTATATTPSSSGTLTPVSSATIAETTTETIVEPSTAEATFIDTPTPAVTKRVDYCTSPGPNTAFTDGTYGWTDECAGPAAINRVSEITANGGSCDGTTCTNSLGMTFPDPRAEAGMTDAPPTAGTPRTTASTPTVTNPPNHPQVLWSDCLRQGNTPEQCREILDN
ncbi:hypothetical protein [Rhodococcus sp. 27YEA6]|uniref:hypothetical protein n=1 Tax=Rhodococcus sp. 27YEA6 TaxID=3156273 RepID=UPI0038352F4B